ncbi:MAG: hypothetical protein KC462_05260 [Cyanobacteria bacterium HKST-UBA05]|nr:hypothetical protein [Cyanobacteria bacterium HKST-UBA05]
MAPIPNFNARSVATFQKARQEADRRGNNDGYTSRDELKAHIQYLADAQKDPAVSWNSRGYMLGVEKDAAQLMLDNYKRFSDTLEVSNWWTFGEGITSRSVDQVARFDGNAQDVSDKDIKGKQTVKPPPPNNNQALATSVYLQVFNDADRAGNGDGKVSKAELQAYEDQQRQFDRVRGRGTDAYEQSREKMYTALDNLQTYFSRFATNRGQPPGSIQTDEFRLGEDDHIRRNEIQMVATTDGNGNNVSKRDLTGQPVNPPVPFPPPSPVEPVPVDPPVPPSPPVPIVQPPSQNDFWNLMVQIIELLIARLSA